MNKNIIIKIIIGIVVSIFAGFIIYPFISSTSLELADNILILKYILSYNIITICLIVIFGFLILGKKNK